MAKSATATTPKLATVKQFRAVVFKFAKQIQALRSVEDKFWFRLWKQVEAVLARHNPEGVTAEQVQAWFKTTDLPDYLVGNLQLDELIDKGSKPLQAEKWAKSKTGKQPKTEKQARTDSKKSVTDKRMTQKPKTVVQSVKQEVAAEFKKRLGEQQSKIDFMQTEFNELDDLKDTVKGLTTRMKFQEEQVSALSDDIQTIKSGMEQILLSIKG